MKIKILSSLWGHEYLPQQMFLDKVRLASYDGFDTWVPGNTQLEAQMFDYLLKHEMYIVTNCRFLEIPLSYFSHFFP